MTYELPTNETIGLSGLLRYINESLGLQHGFIGDNFLSLFIMAPMWLIIFLPLSRYNSVAAFTTANFILMLIAYFLMTMGIATTIAFGVFGALTIIGVIAFFLRVGQ